MRKIFTTTTAVVLSIYNLSAAEAVPLPDLSDVASVSPADCMRQVSEALQSQVDIFQCADADRRSRQISMFREEKADLQGRMGKLTALKRDIEGKIESFTSADTESLEAETNEILEGDMDADVRAQLLFALDDRKAKSGAELEVAISVLSQHVSTIDGMLTALAGRIGHLTGVLTQLGVVGSHGEGVGGAGAAAEDA